MGSANVSASVSVDAPVELVFERITDHEAMRDWPGVSKCVLISEGEPRNGLGAVRLITARGLTLHERVVFYEDPVGYDYTIFKGLPVEHLGKVRLASTERGVEVSWKVRLQSRVPLLAQTVGGMLQRGLPGALRYFKEQTEAASRRSMATPP